MAEAAEQSLYARLGGYDAIAAAVDDLLPRLTIAFKKKILRNTRLKQPELIRLAGCRAPEFLPGYWQT